MRLATRHPAGAVGAGPSREAMVRRLVIVVGAVVFIDTMLYAVISPMLPHLSHRFGLSKLSAGVLAACYPAGMLLASLPGGALAVRIGPRRTVIIGLVLLSGSTVAFAVLNTALGLDLARAIEGVGGACTWGGGLAWISSATPADRRGEIVGKALAAAIAGAVLGPAIGALSSATGRPILFTVLAASGLLLAVVTMRLPDEVARSGQSLVHAVRAMFKPAVLLSGWLVALPAVASGMTGVLGSLRMHRFGASAAVIGLTFLVGAGLEAVEAPLVGRMSDARGRMLPLRVGMVAAAATLVGFTLSTVLALIIGLIVLVSVSLGAFWAPSMAMLADAADVTGLDQAHAAALMNLTWAAGQILGSAGGGAGAGAFGDAPVALTFAVVCAATLLVARGAGERTRSRRPAPAQDPGPDPLA